MQEIFTAAYLQSLKKEKCQYSIEDTVPANAMGNCLYRNNGKKCFIGAVIPDELYHAGLEHRGGMAVLCELKLINQRSLDRSIAELKEYDDLDVFVAQLQKIHDSIPIAQWDTCLRKLAEDYHLQIPTVPLPDSNSMTVQL
jgi:hypothetical protein